ncbi:hypothetical protein WS67_02060 [Burkholderia singularis]|uniref:DUF3318 domain-containing protein n=1 Tax=Burkholderia singularis TaxID=1503053 RepID=A0A103DX48_9BURK|nr:DUF3318 domain-containing protein [Burkholderia singularis]KVE24348.1 hypothetical protein WS67_02060 [Burkholderia singularis]
MSHSATDPRFRTASHKRRISAAEHRALRKELLLLRSGAERAEFAHAGAELRQSVTQFKWLKLIVPGLSANVFGKSARNVNTVLGALVNQYPLLSSLASILLAKPARTLLRVSARPALKWGAVGFAMWNVYRIWKQMKSDNRQSGSQTRNRKS